MGFWQCLFLISGIETLLEHGTPSAFSAAPRFTTCAFLLNSSFVPIALGLETTVAIQIWWKNFSALS